VINGIRTSPRRLAGIYFYIPLSVTLGSVIACFDIDTLHGSTELDLKPGQTRTVVVPAKANWAGTGIVVKRGEVYRFESLPPDRWYDFYYPTSARGYSSLPFQSHWESKRRVPLAPWFALCGSVERAGKAFQIHINRDEPLPGNGEVGLFANDVPSAYWNNSGSLHVRITRIR
jgi:hypothetical protein